MNEVTLQNNAFYMPVSGGKIGLLDNTIKKQEVPFAELDDYVVVVGLMVGMLISSTMVTKRVFYLFIN